MDKLTFFFFPLTLFLIEFVISSLCREIFSSILFPPLGTFVTLIYIELIHARILEQVFLTPVNSRQVRLTDDDKVDFRVHKKNMKKSFIFTRDIFCIYICK